MAAEPIEVLVKIVDLEWAKAIAREAGSSALVLVDCLRKLSLVLPADDPLLERIEEQVARWTKLAEEAL